MLRTLKSLILTRRRKRRRCINGFYYSSILYSAFLIIGCLTSLPKGLTQHSENLYIVKPTPALQFGKEELTTVLYVNNENHGRFINVRPEVGLLTSTARTFIQEGVTTEYATKVVGTTLDNGRVYAQYLKKSSRVLYDKKGVPLPSVVTSWVGESLHSDAMLLPQSHNDLFSADQSDWQAIDDRLLFDRQHFIGNTDYVESLQGNTRYLTSSKKNEEKQFFQGTAVGGSSFSSLYLSNARSVHNSVPLLGVLDQNSRNVAANKVLPIADLPTYTIKLNYEPSVQFKLNESGNVEKISYNGSVEGFDRIPKLIYKKLMQNNFQEISSTTSALKPLIPYSRHFATVTYYGFADFTTVVGESVIVFSPRTSTPNINLQAHVTSIKGEATLDVEEPNISKLPITLIENLIEPTLIERSSVETLLPIITTISVASEIFSENTETKTATTIETKTAEVEAIEFLQEKIPKILLQTSETMMQSPQSEILTINSEKTTAVKSRMLSRPSDEDILRIYNSLANAKSDTTQETTNESTSRSSTIENTNESTPRSSIIENIIETPNVQIFGGATTIFFEEVPFANFVDDTKSKTNLQSNKLNLEINSSNGTLKESILNQKLSSAKKLSSTTSIEKYSTESSEFKVFSMDTTTFSTTPTILANMEFLSTEKSLYDDKTALPTLLSNVLIKEIDSNKDEIPRDCISTSQVFLTQLPETITNYEAIAVTNDLPESVTKTRLQIQPTFEIKEATEYYCIQATSTPGNQIENSHFNTNETEGINGQTRKESHTTKKKVALKEEKENDDNEENKTKNNIIGEDSEEIITQQPIPTTDNRDLESKFANENSEEQKEEENESEDDEVEMSGQPDEDDVNGDADDEEIDLIYKTLYTTYTYLTTFFHDYSTSVSSHTEVVTNVMTSTLRISASTSVLLQNSSETQLSANLNENEIDSTSTINSAINSLETTPQRYMVPSEVESLIRTDEHLQEVNEKSIEGYKTSESLIVSSKTLATFYTTYTYYTTIFGEGDTDIMSHTEVVTNIKKNKVTAVNIDATPVMATTIASFQPHDFENLNANTDAHNKADNMSEIKPVANNSVMILRPNIPDLGDLSAITLVTDVRSSSSSGDQQIINQFENKMNFNEPNQQQQFFLLEDQVSSESNTDTDEIIPSATLLLQTSFTTFTYYTTIYSGGKINVISRLETLTNTVTETLQPSKTVELDESAATIPVTYFTTFTYWTKLARDGQITTLSREETISNVITPTIIQQEEAQTGNVLSMTSITRKPEHTASILNSDIKEETETEKVQISQTSQQLAYITKVLEPTTYYTTFTYYTTSYESDKTITDSRFETVTDIIIPTVTLTKNVKSISTPLISSTFPPSTIISTTPIQQNNATELETELIMYDFKKIIDADGISTIFFRTEIKPTKNSKGEITNVLSSTSSLLIDEEKQKIQATEAPSLSSQGKDGQQQKQYKTGLVRLIEGTRIANRTTTLYQSKVIGTVIDQRYAQIIESTSSFIYEKLKTKAADDNIHIKTEITPQNLGQTAIVATQLSSLAEEVKFEESISEENIEKQEVNVNEKTNKEVEPEESGQAKSNDERLRYPFQTKKSSFRTSPLKTFSNRNRPQFAPKKNSSATIITRSDFTPTITATPALKTTSRLSTIRRGSSNTQAYVTSSRRFGRPSRLSVQGLQAISIVSPSSSRNRFVSSSNVRGSFASSSRRLTGPSLSRPSLFSSAFPLGNSRLRLRPTASVNLGETSSTLTYANSQEDKGDSTTTDETVKDDNDDDHNEEELTNSNSNRRQNNPLLRLRRPLNRPQGFTPAKSQSNSLSSAVSLRRNLLTGRSRNITDAVVTTTSTTTTVKPKPRTFQLPLISRNRRPKPTNTLFSPKNIFLPQKSSVILEQNKDISEEVDDDDEDLNDNNDDPEYEDDDDEEEIGDETNDRSRRSYEKSIESRRKREADPAEHARSNFRNRFRRPKLASTIEAEPKTSEEDKGDSRETQATAATTSTSPNQRTRSRFGARYTGHPSSSSTTATSSILAPTISPNHKAIRPTRPTNSIGVRAQFTLREKEFSPSTSTQKGLTTVKRPAFRRPQLGNSISSRRLPSSTATPSTSKRRLKAYTNSGDTATTVRNSITTRNRSSSSSSSTSRSRSTGSSRDSNVRGRARNNFNNNNNNNNDGFIIDNSGTITVTHVIPIDVTIPIINGKLTEYKQVVTAKTSTEVLGPLQYSTITGSNGFPQLVLTREDTSVNYNGATEVTQYILHDTPTTTITFTPTTIRGRKTSFSHVLPSTAYSVEQVVSTVQPQISANAPLANILLSQLLLGNVGLPAANPLLGALGGALTQPGIGFGTAIAGPQQPAIPVTEYKTHASTYVTTVFEGQSTVLPVTFQGKKILTTVYDTTAQTITATEFITDTIITTPTVLAPPQPIVNSLLLQQLLLQQHLQQQKLQQPTPDPINPLNAILSSVPPQFLLGGDNLQELEVSNTIRGSGHRQLDPLNEDDDFAVGSSIDLDDIVLQVQPQAHKNGRKKSRKNGKNHKRKQNNNVDSNPLESSVITLYVSGRRPGEFSTVLSTVKVRPDSTQYKRHIHTIDSIRDYFDDGSELINEYLAPPLEIRALDNKASKKILIAYDTEFSTHIPTQSLESIVGDVSQWHATLTTTANNIRLSHTSTEIEKQKSSSIAMKSIGTVLNNFVKMQNFFA